MEQEEKDNTEQIVENILQLFKGLTHENSEKILWTVMRKLPSISIVG